MQYQAAIVSQYKEPRKVNVASLAAGGRPQGPARFAPGCSACMHVYILLCYLQSPPSGEERDFNLDELPAWVCCQRCNNVVQNNAHVLRVVLVDRTQPARVIANPSKTVQ